MFLLTSYLIQVCEDVMEIIRNVKNVNAEKILWWRHHLNIPLSPMSPLVTILGYPLSLSLNDVLFERLLRKIVISFQLVLYYLTYTKAFSFFAVSVFFNISQLFFLLRSSSFSISGITKLLFQWFVKKEFGVLWVLPL